MVDTEENLFTDGTSPLVMNTSKSMSMNMNMNMNMSAFSMKFVRIHCNYTKKASKIACHEISFDFSQLPFPISLSITLVLLHCTKLVRRFSQCHDDAQDSTALFDWPNCFVLHAVCRRMVSCSILLNRGVGRCATELAVTIRRRC